MPDGPCMSGQGEVDEALVSVAKCPWEGAWHQQQGCCLCLMRLLCNERCDSELLLIAISGAAPAGQDASASQTDKP